MKPSSAEPVIGEKPMCQMHSKYPIDFICTSFDCPTRVLCQVCSQNHDDDHPYHANQVTAINNWYKEYSKISKGFDPRVNSQFLYHVEELGTILKKEKLELEDIGKSMDEAFHNAVSYLLQKIRSIKEHFNECLWRDFIAVYDKYDGLVRSFHELKKE